MKNTDKATPRLIRDRVVSSVNGRDLVGVYFENTNGNKNVLECTTENADYIVKAVNSHDALVEALRMCRVALTPHVFIDDDAREARNNADRVLKQAEEL